jgi:hypothetical protein
MEEREREREREVGPGKRPLCRQKKQKPRRQTTIYILFLPKISFSEASIG